jgi:hypothetical protein
MITPAALNAGDRTPSLLRADERLAMVSTPMITPVKRSELGVAMEELHIPGYGLQDEGTRADSTGVVEIVSQRKLSQSVGPYTPAGNA